MKPTSVLVAAAVLALTACSANASVVDIVDMTFQSGATFAGTVTFANDFSSVVGVNGVLTGYQFGDPTYLSSFSDAINTPNTTFPEFTGPGTLGTYLLDGPDPNYSHFIVFTYDYSGAPTLTFSSDGFGNSIDSSDPFVSGSISAAATPLPATWTMLLLGLAGLGFILARPARAAAFT
jgi:hypothetical protein